MRRFLLCFATTTSLLCGQTAAFAAAAVNDCTRASERPAFDVAELKSELMVTAISCKKQDRYNAFIGRYKNDIVADEKVLNTYFSRAYGRQAQKQHDEYVTNLANVQSQQGEKMGTAFCNERLPMFDEVMALQTPSDLSGYAEGKDLARPAALTICTSEPVEKPVSGHHAARRAARRHH